MAARFAVLACIVTGAASFLHATSIVILRSPTRVYVGADSRRTYRDPNGFYAGSVCKIVSAGRLVFVASGLTYANNQQVADIGAESGRMGQPVPYAMEIFRGRMEEFLPRALAAEGEIQQSNNQSRGGLVLESAFVGFENGVATVSTEWYRRSGTVANPQVTTDRRTYSSAVPERYDFIFLGRRRAADRYLAGRSTLIRGDRDAIALITTLINLEASESPDTTAPPIDILEMDTFGTHWLARKAACGVSY